VIVPRDRWRPLEYVLWPGTHVVSPRAPWIHGAGACAYRV